MNNFEVPMELAKCGNSLSGGEVKLFLLLSWIARDNFNSASEEELVELSGLSKVQFYNYMRRLESKGLVSRNAVPYRSGKVYKYTINSLKSWWATTGRKLKRQLDAKKAESYKGNLENIQKS